MLATTLSILRQNPAIYLLLLVVYLTVHWLVEQGYIPEWSWYLTVILNLLLAFLVHRAVLFKQRFAVIDLAKRSVLLKAGEFASKSIGISILSLGMIFLSMFAAFAISGFALPGNIVLIVWFFIALATLPVPLAFVGTWLPASVYGQASSFGEAIRRGRSTFFPLLGKLLASFALNFAITGLVSFAFVFYTRRTVPTMSGSGLFDLIGSTAIAIENIAQLMLISMGAVALSLTYVKAEGLNAPPDGSRNEV